MITKRLFAIASMLVISFMLLSQGALLNAAPLRQNATATPQAEEEPMESAATPEAEEEPMAAEATPEAVEEMVADSADAPTVAELAAQITTLQTELAAAKTAAQRNGVNMAIYLLDQAGLHALDVQLNEDGELDASAGGRVGQVARLLTTVDWTMDLAADAEQLTDVLTDLAAALEREDMETSAPLATEAHEVQHALSHAAVAWLSGGHAEHGHGHSEEAAVTDVDGLLIENVLANLALPSATGSVWLKITNTTTEDEALTGATIPGCGVIELHDMKMENDVMTMFQVEGGEIPIPAGETVTLQRGGLHIMCINKEAPVAVGTNVEITLQFATAGAVVVTAPVVDPGAPMEMGHDDTGEGDMDHGEEGEDDSHSHD
jgi:copper(I)-binding protein